MHNDECVSKQKIRDAMEKIANKHEIHNEGIFALYSPFIADVRNELGL